MKLLLFFAGVVFSFSFLNSIHFNPWSSFLSEIICYISFLLLLLFNLIEKISKKVLIIFYFSLIPIVQFFFGQVYYFSIAFLSFLYVASFGLMVLAGYNLSIHQNYQKKKSLMIYLSYVYIFICLCSSVIATTQWLNLSYNTQYITAMVGNRPFANLAQPNHLATLLSMGVIGCFYLYEKKQLNNYILATFSLFFIFVVALTQSRTTWIFLLVLIIVVVYKRKIINFRLNNKLIMMWSCIYILCILTIPFLSELLSSYFNIVKTTDVIERATTGYLRFEIWSQSVRAIIEKPWFGYGWNQTSAAQYTVIEKYPGANGREWFSSAHNIVLDIIIWNGIILGSLIAFYFSLTYLICLIKNIKIETVFASLMILPILIHSFLEYPFKYVYFLLPAGLFWGVMISELDLKTFKVRSIYFKVIAVFGFVILGYIFKEFNESIDNNVAANTYEMNERVDQFELAYPVYILDEFKYRSQWFALNPYTKLSKNDLDGIGKMVSLHMTPYDLLKYAKILSYNGYQKEAFSQLKILEILYGKKYKCDDIIYKNK
ncbi:O-antigen ligase family protein [Acinetobacter guillouiae]|uniref:O-antigen ligase family protein n=1 Tax=Acinetobacter guillouiae TaxID=106649 RepID=UPI00125F558F|nr:O-antigen ligase family protein [Acinetobacter guillouiae]